jgi:hypothetical protein
MFGTLSKRVKEQVGFIVSGIHLSNHRLAAYLETSRNPHGPSMSI